MGCGVLIYYHLDVNKRCWEEIFNHNFQPLKLIKQDFSNLICGNFPVKYLTILQRILLILSELNQKKKIMAPFYGLGLTASRLEPLPVCSLLFTTKLPEISGTHLIDLGRMKGWVDFGTTQCFSTRDPWIGNPAPLPLGHCSIKWLKTKSYVLLLPRSSCF